MAILGYLGVQLLGKINQQKLDYCINISRVNNR